MDDDDDHITGFEIQEQSSPAHDEYKYEVLNADEIVENMVSSIRDVNSVVQLNTTITRILLNHFEWDKERLYERLFDGNRESLFKEAKIIDTETLQSAQSTILSTSNHHSHHHKQQQPNKQTRNMLYMLSRHKSTNWLGLWPLVLSQMLDFVFIYQDHRRWPIKYYHMCSSRMQHAC